MSDLFPEIVSRLTLRQKIGQLIVGQLEGTELTPEFRAFLRDCPLGGYRVHRANLLSLDQIRNQIRAVEDELGRVLPGLGTIFATDEEGGVLSMFGDLTAPFPGTMALGATGEPSLARAQGQALAWTLADVGVNLDFAPVADVNLQESNPVIGVRAFGDDPQAVSRFVLAFEDGLHQGGAAGCAKHFPGHGNTTVDSHEELPSNPGSWETLERTEIPPFGAYIRARGDSVMVSHVLYPAVTGDQVPASLNPRIIRGLLRDRLGYDGVVMSDDLCMGAIRRDHSVSEAFVLFLEAGGDLALINSRDRTFALEAVEALLRAVGEGRISEARIDRSLVRVLALKMRIAGYRSGRRAPGFDARELSLTIARRSLTRVGVSAGVLPLDPRRKVLLVLPEPKRLSQADTSDRQANRLGEFLRRHTDRLTTAGYAADDPLAGLEGLVEAALGAEVVLLGLVNAVRFPAQAELLNRLRTHRPVVAVLLRDPYDAALLPSGTDAVATYSVQDPSMEALAEALFGEGSFRGRLPVRVGPAGPP